jgi:tRNA (guanine37-N1)-methyltransferase
MHITILTLFPQMFAGPFDHSIIARAEKKGLIDIHYIDIRSHATDSHKSVDDHPYGGGTGMILKVDVVDRALTEAKTRYPKAQTKSILFDPGGTPYGQSMAKTLSNVDHLILVCGHYEGVDARARTLVDEEVSIGDYVLTGGEIPAMVVVDSVVRLLPGVLRDSTSSVSESFSDSPTLLEYPQYTKPQSYKKMTVPDILLSGNHANIEEWRQNQAIERTKKRRPDLLTDS